MHVLQEAALLLFLSLLGTSNAGYFRRCRAGPWTLPLATVLEMLFRHSRLDKDLDSHCTGPLARLWMKPWLSRPNFPPAPNWPCVRLGTTDEELLFGECTGYPCQDKCKRGTHRLLCVAGHLLLALPLDPLPLQPGNLPPPSSKRFKPSAVLWSNIILS